MSAALLLLRAVFGLSLAAHGSQKAFGWFGGGGPPGTRAMMERSGYRPTWLWALTLCVAEVGGGCLLALGLLAPLAGMLITAAMLRAIVQVHLPKGFFAGRGGIELPLLFLTVAVVVLIGGPGRYALDHLLPFTFPEPLTGAVALALGVAGSLLPPLTRAHRRDQRAAASTT